MDRGVKQLGIERLISIIQPGNHASRKVAFKNGMELEEEIVLNGQEVCIYSSMSR